MQIENQRISCYSRVSVDPSKTHSNFFTLVAPGIYKSVKYAKCPTHFCSCEFEISRFEIEN